MRIDPDKCICCGACVELCPIEAIYYPDRHGETYYQTPEISDACVSCGQCAEVCDSGAIEGAGLDEWE